MCFPPSLCLLLSRVYLLCVLCCHLAFEKDSARVETQAINQNREYVGGSWFDLDMLTYLHAIHNGLRLSSSTHSLFTNSMILYGAGLRGSVRNSQSTISIQSEFREKQPIKHFNTKLVWFLIWHPPRPYDYGVQHGSHPTKRAPVTRF